MITASSFKSLFGNTITSESGVEVKFDGIMSSSDNHSNTVTHRPVEEGFEKFDAIHQNPPTLSISVLISDNMQNVTDLGKVGAIANIGGFNIVNSNTSKQLNKLAQIYSSMETVSITTKYREYVGYWIEDRTFDETPDEGVIVNLSLIKKVENKRVDNAKAYSNALGIFR